jgi:hypothetical protein
LIDWSRKIYSGKDELVMNFLVVKRTESFAFVGRNYSMEVKPAVEFEKLVDVIPVV